MMNEPLFDKKLLNSFKTKLKEYEKDKENQKEVKSEGKKSWDALECFNEEFGKLPELNSYHLLLAMSIAYSWMPTMLHIGIDNFKELDDVVNSVKKLGQINSLSRLNEYGEEKSCDDLNKISCVINNSIVGTSKVLHIFYPNNIPIIDSRVMKSWNYLFREVPKIKLKNDAKSYYTYWAKILEWNENVEDSSVREIEKLFYDFGEFVRK